MSLGSNRNHMTASISEKVAWLIPTMGYGSQLLYWEPILVGYVRHVSNCKIFVTKDKQVRNGVNLPIEPVLRKHLLVLLKGRHSRYNKAITLVHPSVIIHLLRYHPKIIVISEFGMLSIYGLLASRFLRGCRLLLLVESDPKAVTGSRFDVRYWIRRLICRGACAILTNNRSGERYLSERLRVPREKIIQAPYLVSQPAVGNVESLASDREKNIKEPADKERLIFLYVGQISERKGIEYLVKAVALLDLSHRRSCRFWIVGDGVLRAMVESLVNELGLQESFRFFGNRPYSELPGFYRSADVFVFPTLNDYRALVGFEAAGYGLPLLLSRGDGAAEEIVIPGENGYLFDPLNVEEFAKHLAWFIDNKMELPRFRQRSLVLSGQFTVDHAVQNLVRATEACLVGPQLR